MRKNQHIVNIMVACGCTWFVAGCGHTFISRGEQYGVVASQSMQGLVRLADQEVIYPTEYDSVELYERDQVVRLRRGENCCLGTTQGQLLLQCVQRDITVGHSNGMVSYMGHDGLGGVVRLPDGKSLVSNAKKVDFIHGHGMAIVTGDQMYGIMQQSGHWLTPVKCDALAVDVVGSQVYARYKIGEGWGLAVENSGQVLAPSYEEIALHPDVSMIRIRTENKDGLALIDGRVLFAPKSDSLAFIHSEGAIYKQGNLYGFVGIDGTAYSEPIYDNVRGYYIDDTQRSFDASRLFAVRKDGLWGVVDGRGIVVAETRYPYLFEWAEALIIRTNGKYGALNYKGEEVVPFIYDTIKTPNGGRALAYIGGEEQYVYLSPEYEAAWKRKYEEEHEARVQELKEQLLRAERRAVEEQARLEREEREQQMRLEREEREHQMRMEREAIQERERVEREANEQAQNYRARVQQELDAMSERVTKINKRLDEIGTQRGYDDERKRLKTELEDLRRRIAEKERERRDLYR